VERLRRAADRGLRVLDGGLVPAAIAALALLLTYQEMPEFIWLWGNLLAALAIARRARRALPEIRERLSHGEFRGAGHRTAAIPVAAGSLCAVPAAGAQRRQLRNGNVAA
jgi:hypothetical protein